MCMLSIKMEHCATLIGSVAGGLAMLQMNRSSLILLVIQRVLLLPFGEMNFFKNNLAI